MKSRLGKPGGHAAEFGVQLRHDVLLRPGDPCRAGVLVPVERGRAVAGGVLRGEHGRQLFVFHADGADASFGRGHRFGHDGGNPLPAEPHHGVQHPGVVGVVGVELVLGAGKQQGGSVLMRQNGHDARGGQGRGLVDGQHPGVGVRRADQLQMEQPGQLLRRDVQRVAGLAGHDGTAGGGCHVVAQLAGARRGLAVAGDARARSGGIRVALMAAHGVADGPVARAAAQVPLQASGQVLLLGFVEGCGRHHHAGGAEAALEALPVQELLLHRMERFARGSAGGSGQALDGGDGVAVCAHGRVDAAVHRCAVNVDGAGAAVPAVAALLDAKTALFAQERAQALAGARLGVRCCAVDFDGHDQAPSCGMDSRRGLCGGQKSPDTRPGTAPARVSSSARISAARRYVMSRRQAGRP